jgi:hypothetical protein
VAGLAWGRTLALPIVLTTSTIVLILRTTSRVDQGGAVLFGVTWRAALSVLFADPDCAVYLRELARTTGTSPGAMQREVPGDAPRTERREQQKGGTA